MVKALLHSGGLQKPRTILITTCEDKKKTSQAVTMLRSAYDKIYVFLVSQPRAFDCSTGKLSA